MVPTRSPQDAAIRHVGPAAQDFYTAFGRGDNDRTITTLDADGISLKAIQALHARSDHLQEQTTRLQEENAALRAELAPLREAVGGASGNVIEENLVTGNTNGIYIAAAVGKNVVRQNTAVGNPPIQVAGTRPEARALDIVNLAPATQTEFDRNRCLTALNAPCPAVAP